MIIEIQEIILPISNDSRIYLDSAKYSNEIIWTKWFNNGNIKTVRILGNYGSSCRANISNFPIDSIFMFALDLRERRNYLYDLDFSISNCETYWLPYKDESVKGNIIIGEKQNFSSDVNIQEMDIIDFRKKLKDLRK
jgi:hypothetical protein